VTVFIENTKSNVGTISEKENSEIHIATKAQRHKGTPRGYI
jgi:hypothetical protein